MDKETQHSEDFIKDFTQGKNPFKTPENYFDDLSERLHIASIESEFPKETGFKVPNNYFEDFKVKRAYNTKVLKLIPYISIAACLMIGVFLFKNNSNNSVQLEDENVISYLTYEESIAYDEIISNLTINDTDLAEADLDGAYVDIEQLSQELREYDVIDF